MLRVGLLVHGVIEPRRGRLPIGIYRILTTCRFRKEVICWISRRKYIRNKVPKAYVEEEPVEKELQKGVVGVDVGDGEQVAG